MSFVTDCVVFAFHSGWHGMGVGDHVMNSKPCFHQPLLELFKGSGDQR